MPSLREERRLRTEVAIVAAATELFLQNGYTATTLETVARKAGVAPRTIYVRFETKARLFQRVIAAATVGDTDETPLPDREWSIRSMTGATLDERIDAFADGVAEMNERLGPLMAVNAEVESQEPEVQQSAQVARDATLTFLRRFWVGASESELLPAGVDLEWLINSSAIMSAAETRLIITRHLGWSREQYRRWIATSWRRLVAGSLTAVTTDARDLDGDITPAR